MKIKNKKNTNNYNSKNNNKNNNNSKNKAELFCLSPFAIITLI